MASLLERAEAGNLSPRVVLSEFVSPQAAAAACGGLPKQARSDLLAAWMDWPGQPDQTKRGAVRDFKRIFSISAQPPSPPTVTTSPTHSALRQRMLMLQELDIPIDVQLGCASRAELADLLDSASQHDLRDTALRLRTGLSVPAADLVEFSLSIASFPAQSRAAKLHRAVHAPAASASSSMATPPRLRPSFPNSPLKRAPPNARTRTDSDSSSSDSYDSQDVADARPVRPPLQLPAPPRPTEPRADASRSYSVSDRQPLTAACVTLAEPGAESSAQLTLAIIEDALRVREIRPGALQLFEALALRADAPPPKPSSLSSGTFLARVHTPISSPGGRWTMAAPSYTFARRKDLSCAPTVQSLVTAITPSGPQSVRITLDNKQASDLAASSGVYG